MEITIRFSDYGRDGLPHKILLYADGREIGCYPETESDGLVDHLRMADNQIRHYIANLRPKDSLA
jgi:hypothetical protein